MTMRDSTIAKLQQLSEPLLKEVNDFIDFVIHKHQIEIIDRQSHEISVEAWSKWFEAVDLLDTTPTESANSYQQLLLNKYREQGLDL